MSKSFKREPSDRPARRQEPKDKNNKRLHNILSSIKDPKDADAVEDDIDSVIKERRE